MVVDFESLYYYDLTSPSGLRRKTDWLSGSDYHIVKAQVGDVAGSLAVSDRHSYYVVKVEHTSYRAHRVIWELFNGEIKQGWQVDHVDGNSLNNDIANLRCVENVTNARNQKFRSTNTSKVCGVGLLINRTKYGENRYWKSQWNNLSGRRCAKCFSIATLGNDEAFRLACEHRTAMIEELNLAGAGYTDTHGIRA